MSAALLFLTPLFPILLALVVLSRPALSRWSALGLAPALVVLLSLDTGSGASYDWWLMGSELALDRVAQVFLGFTLLLWLSAALLARDEIHPERQPRFAVCFLLTMAGNLGAILAQDAVTFYLYFALMSFASYGLVIQRAQPASRYAGLVYLIGIVLGEVALFVGLVMLDHHAGGISFAAMDNTRLLPEAAALLLLGFGIKSGLLLLHVWMPLAYAAAPTAAAVVLAGAMVNTGVLGWMRFLPLGWETSEPWGRLFLVLGFMGAFYGVVMGLLQRNPRVILAYSSVSQMGLITALLGLGLMAPRHWPHLLTVVLIYAAHHALVKGALFMGLGILAGAAGKQRLWVLAGLWLVALAMAGAPLLSGAVAKLAYKEEAKAVLDLGLLLSLSALATALLMARLLDCLRHLPPTDRSLGPLSWCLLLIGLLVWPWLWSPARELMTQSLSVGHVLASLWPILVAALLYAGFMLMRRLRFQGVDLSLPPGDVLMGYEAVGRLLARVSRRLVDRMAQLAQAVSLAWRQLSVQGRQWLRVGAFEGVLLRWEVAWAVYVLLILLVLLTAVWI